MKKIELVKKILRNDMNSFQKWYDLECRIKKPSTVKSPEESKGADDWKKTVNDIRFRNWHIGL